MALWIAIGVASFTVAEWTLPSFLSLDQGMFGGDTTWYHMPFSAAIAQDGSTWPLHFTDPLRLAAWFYPASTELVNAATIVLFKSDWLAPLQNLIWLAIALLAAYCVGRPYKVGPATLVAAAIVLDSGVMIETQPGEARNDIMGLAFLLAFAAFLINGHQRRAPAAGAVQDTPEENAPLLDKGPLVMAGIAAGLAASVKFTFLIPVAAITIGVILFSGRGRRWTTTWVMGAADAGGRRLLVPAGGDPHRRQPDPDHQVRPAQPADARPDAARPAAALLGRPLPDRTDDLPALVLPRARQRARAAVAADPDHGRLRRGLHRLEIEQQDPPGDRRRRRWRPPSSTCSRR